MAGGQRISDDFEEFFRRDYRLVYSGLVLAVRDRDLAREAANEAFARAWVRRGRVLRMEHPRAWVAKVGFNYAMKQLNGTEVPFEAPAAAEAGAADPGEEVELRDRVRHYSPFSVLRSAPSSSCATISTFRRGTRRGNCGSAREP